MKAKRNIAIILLLTLTMITILGCSKPMPPEEPGAPPAAEIPATQPAIVAVKSEPQPEKLQEPVKTEQTSVTFSIDCLTVLANPEKLDPNKATLLPKDGFFLPAKKVALNLGETVFDVLLRETRANGIHMEFSRNPALKSSYVEGIGNLYEFDCGELSGWTYLVNGKGIGYGSSSHVLADGDVVEWRYTCDQGRDVGVTAE
jgi:hypothetical protein